MFRSFKSFLVAVGTAGVLVNAQIPRISPVYGHDFEFPLPIMPVKTPLTSYTNKTTGVTTDFYQVRIQPFTKRLFPDLQDASLIGYDGMEPGPTFRVPRGREAVVRFVNGMERPAAIHLHGSYSRAPFDGWAEDVIAPGQYKDYYYPNGQVARTLWYHDHAAGITSINTYAGLTGMYIIEDAALEAELDIPRGAYDVPLILQSRRYTATGNITDESRELTSAYGDTFSVNGQILPHFTVQPRKYRFRILNSAASRTFNLTLATANSTLPFHVIGSDGGFMARPVETRSLVVAMAERWEVVMDFAGLGGTNVTMRQANCFADTAYVGSDRVMQFRVAGQVMEQTGDGPLPQSLVAIPELVDRAVDKSFTFGRFLGKWTINGVTFGDVANRILRNVPRGTTEKWRLAGGRGWSHPVHIHLVDFRILSREKLVAGVPEGRTSVTEYEAVALKDVAVLGENEAVTVLAKYAPWDGVYMFHCHNTVHEDHDMMAVFNVTALADFGYPADTKLPDPMEARFRASAYNGSTTIAEAQEKLAFFSSLGAYFDIPGVESALDEYWIEKNGGVNRGSF